MVSEILMYEAIIYFDLYFTYIYYIEPTTGLDFGIAYDVMSAVRNLANQGITVICTIHQPSSATFALFNTVLLISNGKCLYLGKTDEAAQYFTSSSYGFQMTEGSNAAEFLIAVGGEFTTAANGDVVKADHLATYYTNSIQYQNTMHSVNKTMDAAGTGCVIQNEQGLREWHTSTWNQLIVLCKRNLVKQNKHPTALFLSTFRYYF